MIQQWQHRFWFDDSADGRSGDRWLWDHPRMAGERVMDSFLLNVDGAGGFWVLTGRQVHLGPRGGRVPVDVPLLADPGMPMLCIEREEEDYFLECESPVHVNGRALSRTMLRDGDRIGIGRRCRLRFVQPNPASATGVLLLGRTRVHRLDVQRIILMDRLVLIGSHPMAHVPCAAGTGDWTLQRTAGRWLLRATAGSAPGCAGEVERVLPIGEHVQVGALGLTVTESEP